MAQAAAPAAVSPRELVLGRYRPLHPLGSGGSGSVWLARDESSGVEVALKIVPREGKAGARAEREAAAAARLRHERCLRAFTLARDPEHVYIAYEYVAGRTLRQAMRAGELDDRSAVEAAAQVLDGLAHAHAHGIVHRDVKPSNVLLADEAGVSVRLLDFGLACMQEEETLTAAGDVPGTLAYIPPERLRGEEATAATDVWAVGVMLWEALAGWHPFWTASLLDTARRIEQGATTLARERPDLPRPLVALVDQALALDPARRPPAAKLAAALRDAYRERERRRERQAVDVRRVAMRIAPGVPAALVAGWTAATLPFYPRGWPALLAVAAGALAAARPRAGLAFTLAVPVFPLGNLSAGVAALYGAIAVAWLALAWRSPRTGLAFAAAPLVAPLGALPLAPLALCAVRGRVRRAAYAVAAVLAAAAVAAAEKRTALAALESPFAAADVLAEALLAKPAIPLAGAALGAAAALLPLARRYAVAGPLALAGVVAAVSLLPSPGVAAPAVVAAVWATLAALALAVLRE